MSKEMVDVTPSEIAYAILEKNIKKCTNRFSIKKIEINLKK